MFLLIDWVPPCQLCLVNPTFYSPILKHSIRRCIFSSLKKVPFLVRWLMISVLSLKSWWEKTSHLPYITFCQRLYPDEMMSIDSNLAQQITATTVHDSIELLCYILDWWWSTVARMNIWKNIVAFYGTRLSLYNGILTKLIQPSLCMITYQCKANYNSLFYIVLLYSCDKTTRKTNVI